MVDPESTTEAMYDRYDDNGEHDAATLRAMTGLETDGTADDFSAAAIMARNPQFEFTTEPAAHPDDMKHYGVNAAAYRRAHEADPTRRDRDLLGVSAARLAIERARREAQE